MNDAAFDLPVAPPSMGRIFSVWRRHQRVYFKFFLANMLPPFLEPLMVILALGVGLAAYMKLIQGMSYAAFLAPGMIACLLYTSPSPRDRTRSRMPSSA